MSIKIKFKNRKVLNEVLAAPYHFKMVQLLIWIEERYELLCTSGYRGSDRGVHGTVPCRGFDMRSRIFEDPMLIVNDINSNWAYDRDRLKLTVALYHLNHIHLQVHPNTVFVGEY